MADNTFDDKRIEMMMEKYKEEIVKMQRARPPEKVFKIEKEIEEKENDTNEILNEQGKNEDKAKDKLNPLREIYKREKEKSLFFNDEIVLKGNFTPCKELPEFLKNLLKGEIKASFSAFKNDLPDLQRGEKIAKIQTGDNFDLLFSSFPCMAFSDEEDFSRLADFNFKRLYDKGLLWEYLLYNKDALDFILYYFSDKGTPSSFASCEYTSTVLRQNEGEEEEFFKLILTPKVKEAPFSDFEAKETASEDRDFLKRELKERIVQKRYPEFYLRLQKAHCDENLPCNIFEGNSCWSKEDFPAEIIGNVVFDEIYEGDFTFSLDNIPQNISISKKNYMDVWKFINDSRNENPGITRPLNEASFSLFPKGCDETGFFIAKERMENMSEREKRRLLENISVSMENLRGDILEKALMILTDADLSFGRSLMNMIEA